MLLLAIKILLNILVVFVVAAVEVVILLVDSSVIINDVVLRGLLTHFATLDLAGGLHGFAPADFQSYSFTTQLSQFFLRNNGGWCFYRCWYCRVACSLNRIFVKISVRGC